MFQSILVFSRKFGVWLSKISLKLSAANRKESAFVKSWLPQKFLFFQERKTTWKFCHENPVVPIFLCPYSGLWAGPLKPPKPCHRPRMQSKGSVKNCGAPENEYCGLLAHPQNGCDGRLLNCNIYYVQIRLFPAKVFTEDKCHLLKKSYEWVKQDSQRHKTCYWGRSTQNSLSKTPVFSKGLIQTH